MLWASLEGGYWASFISTDLSACQSCSAPWTIKYFYIMDCASVLSGSFPPFPSLLSCFFFFSFFFLFVQGTDVCFRDAQYLYFFYHSSSQSNRTFVSCFMTDSYWLNTFYWLNVWYSCTIMHQRLICHWINWLCYHGSLYFFIFWELLLWSEATLSLSFIFWKNWLLDLAELISVFWGLDRLFVIQSLISSPPTVYILLELLVCTLYLEENKQNIGGGERQCFHHYFFLQTCRFVPIYRTPIKSNYLISQILLTYPKGKYFTVKGHGFSFASALKVRKEI